jgi:hypothetical protein
MIGLAEKCPLLPVAKTESGHSPQTLKNRKLPFVIHLQYSGLEGGPMSMAGTSSRQRAHPVAHRLMTRTRPRWQAEAIWTPVSVVMRNASTGWSSPISAPMLGLAAHRKCNLQAPGMRST